MKDAYWMLTAAILAFLLEAVPAVATDAGRADLSSVAAVEHGLIKTTKLDDAMQYYAPDGVLIDAFAPEVAVGEAQLREAFGWQFANVATSEGSLASYDLLEHGNYACVATQQHFHTTMKDGKTLDMSVRITDVLRRKDGRWQIVIEHVSMPEDTKTGLAVMDAALSAIKPPLPTEGAFGQPGVSEDQAKAEIGKWLAGDTATQTAEQGVAFYGPGDGMLVFDNVAPGVISGRSQALASWGPQYAAAKSLHVVVTKSGIATDGTFGAVYSLQNVDLTMQDGSVHKLDLRQVNCLHRVDGKWYSIIEENSFPVDPKTGKTVFTMRK